MRNPEKEGELATLPGSRCRLWTSPTRRDRSCHSGLDLDPDAQDR
jgi:hypothetical protein